MPANVDALTLVIIVLGLIALIFWNGGVAFILKSAFVIGCVVGAIYFRQTALIGLVLLGIGGIALLVLVIEPAHKKGQ